MQRWSSIAFGALACAAFAVILWQSSARHVPKEPAPLPAWSYVPPPLPSLAYPDIELPSMRTLAPVSSRPLPPGSPKIIHFGVVLVQHRLSQLAPDGARTKPEALAVAKGLVEVARRDFHEAVLRGDPGSLDDAGRMFRNVTEPNVEYEMFTLPPGAVSEPIDTLRGYWIVKRLD